MTIGMQNKLQNKSKHMTMGMQNKLQNKSKHMTIGMQNKLQNKNRKKGCPIDRRAIENKHMYKINMIC